MFPRRRLLDWIERRQLGSVAPVAYALHHVGSDALVVRLTPTPGTPGAELAGQLADELEHEATEHAEGWGGRQRYSVRAVGAEEQSLGAFAFALAPSSSALSTSAADDLGFATPEQLAVQRMGGGLELAAHPMAQVMNQQMRHTEALVRSMVEMATRHAERDARIIAQQAQQIDRDAARRLESFEIFETLQSKQAERDLAEKTYADDEKRKAELLERLNTLVIPAIARRIGMPPGLTGGSSAGASDPMAEIRRIFFSLPTGTQEQVLEQLSDTDRQTLLAAFQQRHQQQETKH